jgi:hypothetical protein
MENDKLKEEMAKMSKEFGSTINKLTNDLMESYKKSSTTINNTTNNNVFNCKSYNFVINNYTDAYNIEDLMAPELTAEEKKMLDENGHIVGYINLMKTRCIDNVDLEKRAFHCIDTSRNKYMLHKEGAWNIDHDGLELIQSTYPKVKDHFIPEGCDDIDKIIREHARLGHFYSTRGKTLDDIGRMTSLSSNIITNLTIKN